MTLFKQIYVFNLDRHESNGFREPFKFCVRARSEKSARKKLLEIINFELHKFEVSLLGILIELGGILYRVK